MVLVENPAEHTYERNGKFIYHIKEICTCLVPIILAAGNLTV